ncbi:unnamed protein product [Effrenium voratum]|uniref:Cation/H+ exchanger transmembrane domain-containing protein n=1 Tax=Effrenium voratum TaxID=2562239 RepID=A0AA36MYM0_9DINO|nr:unnamed protein product [Effrenium voratum]
MGSAEFEDLAESNSLVEDEISTLMRVPERICRSIEYSKIARDKDTVARDWEGYLDKLYTLLVAYALAGTGRVGVLSRPWPKIFSVAELYIKAQGTEIQRLEAELASADAEIKAASEQKAATVVNDTEVRKLIVEGLSKKYGSAQNFGSVDRAKEVKCGADLERMERMHHLSEEFHRDDDLFLDYFDVAVDIFQTQVAEYAQSEVVVPHGAVLQVCLELLNSTLRDESSDCDELCTQFEMQVRKVSQPGLSTREVNLESARVKRERTWLALSTKQSKLLDCMVHRTALNQLKAHLDGLDNRVLALWKVEKQSKRRVFRAARLLRSLRDELAEQHKRLDKLLLALQSSGAEVSKKDVSPDLRETTDSALASSIAALRSKEAHVKQLVAKVTFANELQAKVILLLLQMQNLFDSSVREPIKDVGVTPQSSFGASPLGKFPRLHVEGVANALKGLQGFCEEEKRKGSEEDNRQALCSLTSVDRALQETENVVNRTQSVVRYRLMQVQEMLKEVPQGPSQEPFGLAQTLETFGTIHLVKNYLSKWQVAGELQTIVANMRGSESQLKEEIVQEARELSLLKEQLLSSQVKRSELIARLEEAIQSQSEKTVAVGDLLQELQAVKRQEGTLQAKLESLQAQEAESAQDPSLAGAKDPDAFLQATEGHWRLGRPSRPSGMWRQCCAQLLLALLAGTILFAATGPEGAPGGSHFALLALYLSASWGAKLTAPMKKWPPLLTMLLAGFGLRNLPFLGEHVGSKVDPEVSSALRQAALALILTRAGLAMDLVALRRLLWVALRLAALPCLCEALVAAALAHLLLEFPAIWALMLGFVVAAISPAVVVPSLLALQEQGYGVSTGIPTMVVAAAPLDDVLAIAGFGICLGSAFESSWLSYARAPLELVLGLGSGLLGAALVVLLTPEAAEKAEATETRLLLLLGGALAAAFGLREAGFSGAAALAVLVLGAGCARGWGPAAKPVAAVVAKLWTSVAQPLLFSLVGASVVAEALDSQTLGSGLAIIAAAGAARAAAVQLALSGRGLRREEKLFTAAAWMPKATVQAAIGGLALDRVEAARGGGELGGGARELQMAKQLLAVAVLCILVTAPPGAALIALLGPRLLDKEPNEATEGSGEKALDEKTLELEDAVPSENAGQA